METEKYVLRSASPDEAELFYSQTEKERDLELGTIGHVRIDFGRTGKEFWHTWWPRGSDELNTEDFKDILEKVIDRFRKDVLKDLSSMEHFCSKNGGEISGGWRQNYGYIIETDRYLFCLRCNPAPGEYQAYLICYDKFAAQLYKNGRVEHP